MYKRIVFHGFLSMFFLSAILGMHFSRLATANPIPVPSLWMPYEYIDAKIFLEDGVVRAEVDGTYPFIYPFPFPPYPLTFDQVVMYYPIPPDADIDKITVEMDETKLDWTYSNETYPTALGDWPMINWTIEPVPECFEINTYYEHSVPVIGGNNTFLYAMGTGRYLDYYAKNTTAYVKVSISKDVADSKSLIDVYTIGYNTAIEEWIWKPADYAITQEDETWIVTLTVISEMFHPLEEDLLITIKAESRTWTVDDDGPADFSTIQEAINAASDGDTIFVYNGTYNESVVVNKTVALTGENRITTIINGRIYVDRVANNVEISGFTMCSGISLNSSNNVIHENIMKDIAGIAIVTLVRTSNNTISNNLIVNNKDGIHAYGTDHLIQGNLIANNNRLGIHTIKGPQRSDKIRIIENNITNNGRGINICGYWNIVYKNIIANNTGAGISLAGFTLKNMIVNNTIASNKYGIVTSGTHDDFHFIYGNVLSNNQYGIYLQYFCENNTIYGNTIEENEFGINLKYSDYNIVHHNNFVRNKEQLYIYQSSRNTWDNGTEGNYWSDYKGKDNDGDEVGDTDTPHLGVDWYPLMNPFEPKPIVPAIKERTVKVKTSDRGKYDSDFMPEGGIWLFPPPEFPELPSGYLDIKNREWVKITVQNVSGTIITFEMISHYINGTEKTEIRYTDVDYGDGSLYWFVSADLEPGDNMYTTSRHLMEETVFRIYAGVTREVNHLTIEHIYYKIAIWPPPDGPDKIVYNLYWDKSTGVLCEWTSDETWTWGGEPLMMSWSIKMIDTNIWSPTRTWTVDDDGPADFSSIQEAINAANPGDTILVSSGTYYENVVINKTVTLIGENTSTTFIDGSGTGTVVDVKANNTAITGFTIQNSGPDKPGYGNSGIRVLRSSGNNISHNVMTNNYIGIFFDFSTSNIVAGSNLSSNHIGISLVDSGNNTLTDNKFVNNQYNFNYWPGVFFRDYNNYVDTSNTVNGKPIYYLNGVANTVFDARSNAGTIYIFNGNNVTIKDLTLKNNGEAVFFWNTTNSKIENVTASNNGDGIWLHYSNSNTLTNNNLSNNGNGIVLFYSDNNTLAGNVASNNVRGTHFHGSSYNTLMDNIVSDNERGISLAPSDASKTHDNAIFHNNFINNTIQVWRQFAHLFNKWDDGYPSGGNYWSDYTGIDEDNDGIGDSQYPIGAENDDRYPLMGPFNAFDAGTWNNIAYSVNVAGNSTVSDFYFNPDEGAFIRFSVTGPDGTTGFCRVAIPKQLLSVNRPEEWIVMVGDQLILPEVSEDENYTYLYFIYTHSTKTVTISGTRVIPEFPTWTPILLILILLTVAIAIYKRRLSSKSFH